MPSIEPSASPAPFKRETPWPYFVRPQPLSSSLWVATTNAHEIFVAEHMGAVDNQGSPERDIV